MDSASNIGRQGQAISAEGSNPNSLESYIDVDCQDSIHFVPNRLQTILTLHWLSQHYEAVEGVSLPRCLIYKHYSDYCQKNQFQAVNAASFGKVIRQVFPELRTRRLGTRGQSKYHYYGIRVKESSPYFGVFLDSQRVTRPTVYRTCGLPFLAGNNQWEESVIPDLSQEHQACMTSMLTLLPEFPSAEQTQPWQGIEPEQVDAVISQYRYHCQKLIDSIVKARLEEVPVSVQEFWQGLPDATRLVLEGRSSDKLADLIAVCDNILYQTMMNILIPGTVHQLPPSLLHAIRHFSCGFQRVVEESLPTSSEYLHHKRVQTVKRFCQLLKRKTSLAHLAQASRAVLKTKATVTQMSHDWRKRTEQNTVCSQLVWTMPGNSASIKTVVKKCFSEFSRLLEKHSSVEDHIKWLNTVRTKCLKTKGKDCDEAKKEETERNFLLQWSYVCNLLIRDQTLRSATSFGSFHLLHLLYEEYLLYMVDVHRNQTQEQALWKKLFGSDVDVPSYFLTSSQRGEFDEVEHLASAPHLTPQPFYHMDADASQGLVAQGLDQAGAPYIFQQYRTPSSLPSATAGSPYQLITLNKEGGKTDSIYTAPSQSTITITNTPTKTMQGYSSSSAMPSPIFPNSPKIYQLDKERDAGSFPISGSQGIVTIPINSGSVTYLQTSPLKAGQSSVTVLPSGYKVSSSPRTAASPCQIVRQRQQGQVQQQQQQQHQPAVVIAEKPCSSQQVSPRSKQPPITGQQYLLKPQQKKQATKIIKAVPVSRESKQKPVSFQFSITTSQKLNLSKGQILTTTNGEKYLINEVQASAAQDEEETSKKS